MTIKTTYSRSLQSRAFWLLLKKNGNACKGTVDNATNRLFSILPIDDDTNRESFAAHVATARNLVSPVFVEDEYMIMMTSGYNNAALATACMADLFPRESVGRLLSLKSVHEKLR